jgi:hypothetical protein
VADDALRMGGNEALFREVNEAIERGSWPGEADDLVRFRCECGRIECNETVQLTLREYERIRAHPRRFFAVPGHEQPEIEDVVERWEGYVLVDKRDEAGELAEALDPRS